MPDDTDETELTQFSRPIGVARTRTGAASVPSTNGTIGVLTPFAGLLSGSVKPAESVFPAFSYLALRPLIVRELLERDRRNDRDERPGSEGGDETERPRELKVHHLLRSESEEIADRPGRSRAPADSVAPEVDPLTTGRSGRVSRPSRTERHDDLFEPIQNITVLELPRRGALESGDPTDQPPESIQTITVLEVPHRGASESGGRTRQFPDSEAELRGQVLERGEQLTEKRSSGTGERTTVTSPTMIASISNATSEQAKPNSPVPRPEMSESGERGSGVRAASEPDGRGDTVSSPTSVVRPGHDRFPAEQGPKLTLATARPAPERQEPRGPGNDEERGDGPGERRGSEIDGGQSFSRTERESNPSRPRPRTTMTSVLNDNTEMNRLVDRLYQEFEKKTRIERERRGL